MIYGILILNKPSGYTSSYTIQKIKKQFNLKKIGHCGTLDPNATGVLIVCIGYATKLSTYLTNVKKRYLVEITTNIKNNTDDIAGETLFFNNNHTYINKDKLIKNINSLKGRQLQIPPIFSALKYKGLALYKYARKNIKIKRIPREIIIYEIKLINIKKYTFTLDIICSKGTYIREIINTLGKRMSLPICTTIISRISAGKYNILNSYSLNDVLNIKNLDNILIN